MLYLIGVPDGVVYDGADWKKQANDLRYGAGALTLACDNLLGVDQCMADMNNIDCKGANGCKNNITTITNPGNEFELFCPDPSENMMLNIYLDGRRRGVDHFGGI